MLKKIFLTSLVLLAGLTLTACKTKMYTVTFDTQGGSVVADVEVEEDAKVTAPTAPTKTTDTENYTFVGWYLEAAGTTAYDFTAKVTADLTLYAVWSLDIVVHFDSKLGTAVDPMFASESGDTIEAPTDPTLDGFNFEGWFLTKRGLTWLEEEAITFPMTVTDEVTLYAYWEPVDSKAISYSNDQTYTSSLTSSTTLILNPLVYQWSHEDTFLDMLGTPLYSTEVDWGKAIEQGVAEYPADFSKIIDRTYSVEALDYINILVGAVNFPVDSEGEEHLDENGLYDRSAASSIKDTEWTFSIRDDLAYEDGTPITSADYEYTVKMFLDPVLNNSRSTIFFKTDENKNGHPLVNSYEYYLGNTTWDEVGFEVVDAYTFTATFFEPVSQSAAIAFANDIRLVQPEAFAASLTEDGTNSTYGTPTDPYVSYGSYILKSWDANAKLVFNKNFDYVLKGTINYKSRVIQIVDDVDQRMSLYEDGFLSVAGLTKDYYAQYAENDNVYKSWDGYPQFLSINLADSLLTEGGHEHSTIMYDVRFRQALFYGFNRKYFATSVYAPNTPALLPVPLDTKSYNQDALYYSESPQHLAVIEDFGIDTVTEGYIPERAVDLFDDAYAAWIADGNSGAAPIVLIVDNDPFSLSLVEYVESSYEQLFGADRIDIIIDSKDPTAHQDDTQNWNFDLKLNSVGFGTSTGLWWMYQAVAFFGDDIGGGFLGLSQPYDSSTLDGFGSYRDTEITVDLTTTYNYLVELGEDAMTEGDLEGHLLLYGYLQEVTDESGTVTKAAGIFQGPLVDLAYIGLAYDSPWDGTAAEPFPGATADTWNMVAAFEAVFFETMPMIPTVTRSSATIYADNVVIDWPAYHGAFDWGAARYRYLNTDTDFQ